MTDSEQTVTVHGDEIDLNEEEEALGFPLPAKTAELSLSSTEILGKKSEVLKNGDTNDKGGISGAKMDQELSFKEPYSMSSESRGLPESALNNSSV